MHQMLHKHPGHVLDLLLTYNGIVPSFLKELCGITIVSLFNIVCWFDCLDTLPSNCLVAWYSLVQYSFVFSHVFSSSSFCSHLCRKIQSDIPLSCIWSTLQWPYCWFQLLYPNVWVSIVAFLSLRSIQWYPNCDFIPSQSVCALPCNIWLRV